MAVITVLGTGKYFVVMCVKRGVCARWAIYRTWKMKGFSERSETIRPTWKEAICCFPWRSANVCYVWTRWLDVKHQVTYYVWTRWLDVKHQVTYYVWARWLGEKHQVTYLLCYWFQSQVWASRSALLMSAELETDVTWSDKSWGNTWTLCPHLHVFRDIEDEYRSITVVAERKCWRAPNPDRIDCRQERSVGDKIVNRRWIMCDRRAPWFTSHLSPDSPHAAVAEEEEAGWRARGLADGSEN